MESASPEQLGQPDPRCRRLFPYERRLVAWKFRRWQANAAIDLPLVERKDGPDRARLFAAGSASFTLGQVIGLVGVVVGALAGKFFGFIAFVVVFGGFFCTATWLFVMAAVRNHQSLRARAEYRRHNLGSEHMTG
jgi:hypothetical protein